MSSFKVGQARKNRYPTGIKKKGKQDETRKGKKRPGKEARLPDFPGDEHYCKNIKN